MRSATTASTLSLPTSAPASARALFALLRRLQVGTLDVQLPDGGQIRFGSGAPGEPQAAVRLHNWKMCSAVLRSGDIGFAETFIAGYGWIATDPADVRKVVLEEPPANLAVNDPKVVAARQTLFGAWEGNWLAYNFAHDVALPGSSNPKVGFLMYPQAECGPNRLDCLDPDSFKYTIKAKEVTAA